MRILFKKAFWSKSLNKELCLSLWSTNVRTKYIAPQKTLVKALTFLSILPQHIIKGVGLFLWGVLLPTTEDHMSVVNLELITKDLILWTEYRNM